MSSIDNFVLRRMQNAALNRWQTKSVAPASVVPVVEPAQQQQHKQEKQEQQTQQTRMSEQEQQLDESIHQILNQLDEEVVNQLQDSLNQLQLGDDSVTDHSARSEQSERPEQDSSEEPQEEQDVNSSTVVSLPSSTYTNNGRPHVGPRRWNQRPVFHDVLDCDLLDDDDDDFFGTSIKNKNLRMSKNITGSSTGPTPKKSKKRTNKPTTTTSTALKNTVSPFSTPRTRSLSPTPPARRNKVMSLAA